MRGAIGVVAAALVCSSLARAEAPQVDPDLYVDDPPRWVVKEHHLVPSDDTKPALRLNEEIAPPPVWEWPRLHLAAGRAFADPFIGPELYPEVSAGVMVFSEHVASNRRVEYSSWATLQLYILEVKVPLVTRVDGGSSSALVHANLKIPFALPGHENHRFALVGGSIIQSSTPAISRSSYAEATYGFVLNGFNFQARGGYGYDQYTPSQPLRLGAIYGAVVAFRAGAFQPMVELDGFRTDVTRSDRITLVPAIRIFPDTTDTLQIGLGGLITFSHGEDTPGKRYGGVVELSYNFL